MSKYTHNNNELTIKNISETVSLKGWVHKRRNLGGLIFIDLRDRFGLTQLVVRPESSLYDLASTLRNEFVIEIKGLVKERESKNKNIKTGDIEVELTSLNILNQAMVTPFTISDHDNISEEVSLKYRYLDLRRPSQQQFLLKRSEVTQSIRKSLIEEGFLELETPYLVKTTPEGAKEFLVPSRLYHGEAYALAQSPQIFKQLYMIAGFEKYFQIARCFRDEDLRSDRQLEFTQIDIEASFVDQEDILKVGEKVIASVFKNNMNFNLELPLKRITYKDAMHLYGSDKPDVRFELIIEDFKDTLIEYNVPLFEGKEVIRGFKIKTDSIFTRKYFDQLTMIVKENHGDALAYVKREDDQLSGSISKFVDEKIINNDEILLLIPGNYENASLAAGALRNKLAKDLNLIDEKKHSLIWVVDFPLFEYDESENQLYAKHHPFTAPKNIKDLIENPQTTIAKAYDMVWNGYEIGGGSIRIHNQDEQALMFETLGFTKEEANEKFGFFIEALKYGTPPHGGIAFGLDRIMMLVTNTNNIKDVIAFPKTQSARDLMMQSPSKIDDKQLKELGIEVKK